MTVREDIFKLINQHNNVLLYKQETLLYEIYQSKTREDTWAYILNPRQGKYALEIVLQTFREEKIMKNMSVANILDEISQIARNKKTPLILFVNYFENINKRTITYYQDLINMGNIYLIVNIVEDKDFVDDEFLQNFIIIDTNEYTSNRAHSINVKYTLLLILSLFIFFLFLRVQLSITSFLVSTLWFTLLMYRSFYYITR